MKSYVSAIKSVLQTDGYEWDNETFKFKSLTRACRLVQDRVKTRLPIRLSLLHILLAKIDDVYLRRKNQPYLAKLYKTIMVLGYYGLLRVGELTCGAHTIKAKDVHVGKNKQKILLVLFTSKTHGLYTEPQQIRIWADQTLKNEEFSPFKITREYSNTRGGYRHDTDQFCIFQDGTPVRPRHFRSLLRKVLKLAGLNSSLYDTHSLRIGHATDLRRFGVSVDKIKQLGRWRSNAVFRYIRQF